MQAGTIEPVSDHGQESAPSGRPEGKPIGVAARIIGVGAHVLRHWEDERVLIPRRDTLGHRRYTQREIIIGMRIRAAQSLGLSLAQIRHFLHAQPSVREELLQVHHDQLTAQAESLLRSASMLSSVLDAPPQRDCPFGLLPSE